MVTYIKFHKPFAVLPTFTDDAGRPTLKDYIPVPRIYAAGRLDFRSEGLMLLTNDGSLIQKLTDPRFEHPKTYLVQVEGAIDETIIKRLNTEIVLPNFQQKLPVVESVPHPATIPPRSQPVRNYHPTSWIKMILREGKKHQVRRMTAAVGYPTLRLIRIAIGPIRIDDLSPGEWRYLSQEERFQLKVKFVDQG